MLDELPLIFQHLPIKLPTVDEKSRATALFENGVTWWVLRVSMG
jgi:hypothetical protein